MTAWAVYCAGLLTFLILLALLCIIYALIVSGTTSQQEKTKNDR